MSRRFRDKRSSVFGELPEPEILPMMNVLFMLVMVLMGMSSFLPIGVIEIQSPQFGGSGGGSAEAQPKLNLKISILETGIQVSPGTFIPKIQQDNRSVYDFATLQAELTTLKQAHPNERRVIITAGANIIYNDITHTMDAARLSKTSNTLFDEIAFSAEGI